MQNGTTTARDKNPAVYGPTGGYTPDGDHATSAAIGQVSLKTITATAGDILKLIELKHWERFGDCVFLIYGLGDGIKSA